MVENDVGPTPGERGRRLRLLVVCGYYDTFANYQELTLARALSLNASVEVFTGDRVAPIFSDEALGRLGVVRTYPTGMSLDGGVVVRRFSYLALPSSIMLSARIVWALRSVHVDAVIILGLGQFFGLPALFLPAGARRVLIFGDNRAQWAGLGRRQVALKRIAFRMTKGLVYRLGSRVADWIFVNTPDTGERLAWELRGRNVELLPLAIDTDSFAPDEEMRRSAREALGLSERSTLVAVVGKATEEKRIEDFLGVLEELGLDEDFSCVIGGVGHDAYGQKLQHMATSSPVLSRIVRFEGFMDNAAFVRLLRAVDVCVWPRQPAITIQQALATGCRIVIPDNALVGHLLTDASDGSRFAEGDLSDLRSALRHEIVRGPDRPAARRRRSARAAYLGSDVVAAQVLARASRGPHAS